MFTRHIGVVRGGPGAEHKVSMLTGASVLEALRMNERNQVTDIVVTHDKEWLVNGIVRDPIIVLSSLSVVFNALHGEYGEDGEIQRLLERASVPFTGSNSLSSRLAMHKGYTKQYISSCPIGILPHVTIDQDRIGYANEVAQYMSSRFDGEFIVKPVSSGSSAGVNIAYSADHLAEKIRECLNNCQSVMVEPRIKGREATVGVLESFRGDDVYVLPAVEIIPPENSDFFDMEAKYSGKTREVCPGRFSYSEKVKMAEAARAIHKAVGLRHYSRSDFIVTEDNIYFLEVNNQPGLTSQSLFPKACSAVGLSFDQLVNHLLELAVDKK